MKTTTRKKKDSMTLVIPVNTVVRMPIAGKGRKTRHENKRHKSRSRKWRNEDE